MEDEPVKVGEVFKCLLAQDTRGHILPIRLFSKIHISSMDPKLVKISVTLSHQQILMIDAMCIYLFIQN